MLSNQIMQTSIEELHNIMKADFCIFDGMGNLIVSTAGDMGIDRGVLEGFAASAADSQSIGSDYLFKIAEGREIQYLLAVRGGEAHMAGRIAVSQLKQLLTAYKEKFDHESFFQNLILDNLLQVDIHTRARKLHLSEEENRAVFLIETNGSDDQEIMELLKGLFLSYNGDYLVTIEEKQIVLVKSVTDGGYAELKETADMIVDMVSAEAMTNVRVAYGTIVHELKNVSKSYKEAAAALEIGRIFYAEKNVTAYNTLGVGRLIYHLPENLCRVFIREIFGQDEIPEELDEEILGTIQKFLENNLNISETSRKLYIHRNTLVYRIEKLEKATGLDVRTFADARIFDIAMMVMNYMKYLKTK